MKTQPDIVFADDHIVVVNKPANYLTIPDRFNASIPSVLGFLNRQYTKVYTVHRLDRETSGLLCFALTAEAHRHLSIQFEKRHVYKAYWVLVDGRVEEKAGSIDASLAPDPAHGGMMRVNRSGKRALTEYEVLEQFKDVALVRAVIKTGRMHQIRVHFRYLGHPLLVDSLYGRRSGFMLSSIKKRYKTAKLDDDGEQPLMSRVTLHSKELSLIHPHTEERITFDSELPKDFAAVLNQLRKYNSL